MRCNTPEHYDRDAVYRTMTGETVVVVLCLTCTELALDMGWPHEELILMPQRQQMAG